MKNKPGLPGHVSLAGKPFLIVVVGPTAVGKTALAIEIAHRFETEVVSADSRQFYREMKIGTAAPTPAELSAVPHHFVGHLSVQDPYNVFRYEQDALQMLHVLFVRRRVVVLTGGSGLYIQAVLKGIDELPDPDPVLREKLKQQYLSGGIESLQHQLEQLDPEYYEQVDRKNPKRLMRALEVCLTTGRAYSQLRLNSPKERDFSFLQIGLDTRRESLYERINQRVDRMIREGLLDEARELIRFRYLNALNTVGYKELFAYFDGEISLEQAVRDIKTHTRKYAKRQLTWFKRDPMITWFDSEDHAGIWNHIMSVTGQSPL